MYTRPGSERKLANMEQHPIQHCQQGSGEREDELLPQRSRWRYKRLAVADVRRTQGQVVGLWWPGGTDG